MYTRMCTKQHWHFDCLSCSNLMCSTIQYNAALLAHLADAAPEVLITGGYDVALVLAHPLTQAVISIRAAVCACDALNAGVLHSANIQADSK